ncbi:3-hydroxyisobutyryl-CoA hydrolase [Penicillium chermesinum]|nr:3-hydroxyisobutyryl-CoA hydrolase [Penicillium chermesinum]
MPLRAKVTNPAFQAAVTEWEKSHLASIVLISGAGPKALCAGGDVAALALQNEQGESGSQASTDFFGLEYRLDHSIATYSKPVISFMDGITMGGGVGLSMHARGSFFLPRLDGETGTYLALTSERLNGVQALYSGIATHYLHSSVLANVTQRLSELVFQDDLDLPGRLDLVNKTMAEFSLGLPSLQEEPILLAGELRNAIDRCFRFNTVEEIFQALEAETEQKAWAQKTLETLSSRSQPHSR